jgi:hypothetical protein
MDLSPLSVPLHLLSKDLFPVSPAFPQDSKHPHVTVLGHDQGNAPAIYLPPQASPMGIGAIGDRARHRRQRHLRW